MIFPAGRTTAVMEKGEKFCAGFTAQPGVKSCRILSDREQNPELVAGSQVLMEMKPGAGRGSGEGWRGVPGFVIPAEIQRQQRRARGREQLQALLPNHGAAPARGSALSVTIKD